MVIVEQLPHHAAVFGAEDVKAGGAKVIGQRFAKVEVVIDDQYLLVFHPTFPVSVPGGGGGGG
ncbi:hypothetical protein, partial [Vibrio diabolicus]|uniref:hypothetical protein n=1 Tax=Vibrio diabolicus TaxID=50719 RepID=UPI00211AA6A7